MLARNSSVSRMKTALMSEAICVCWPAASATELFERLPSTAKPPTSPAAPHAAPWAMSSWFGSISYPCFAAIARAAASDSEYPTKITASAPSSSLPMSLDGTFRDADGEQARGDVAGHGHPVVGEREDVDGGDRERHDDERARHLRRHVAQPEQQRERAAADRDRREARRRGSARSSSTAARRSEPSPPAVPSSLCDLVDDDPDREAEDEPGHDRLGQERRDPAHPQQPEHDVHDAGGERQRGRVGRGGARCRARRRRPGA